MSAGLAPACRRAAVTLALLLGAGLQVAAAAAPLPADSVYHLAAPVADQDGREAPLAAWRGGPVVVAMFYSRCQATCPMLIEALRATEARLGADERARLRVLLLTIDPDHDSVAVLHRMAAERALDTPRWALGRADSRSVRKIAAALGVQYRALPNGEFNHSTALFLLDAEGSVRAKTGRLGSADPDFVRQVRLTLQAAR